MAAAPVVVWSVPPGSSSRPLALLPLPFSGSARAREQGVHLASPTGAARTGIWGLGTCSPGAWQAVQHSGGKARLQPRVAMARIVQASS